MVIFLINFRSKMCLILGLLTNPVLIKRSQKLLPGRIKTINSRRT